MHQVSRTQSGNLPLFRLSSQYAVTAPGITTNCAWTSVAVSIIYSRTSQSYNMQMAGIYSVLLHVYDRFVFIVPIIYIPGLSHNKHGQMDSGRKNVLFYYLLLSTYI